MPEKHITSQQKYDVVERAKGCCEYCRSQVRFAMQSFSVEHIVPRSRGGKTEFENLALACQEGIYENGRVRLLEPVPPRERKANVIVTLLDEPAEPEKKEDRLNLFDDLVGVIEVRKDGSANHDQYLNGPTIQ